MHKIFPIIFLILFSHFSYSQGSFCDMNGNLMIFTNYDGGTLNINVDVNIPNLKIGVVTYESCQIVFSGTYVSNITGVVYAGYSGTNNHCGTGTTTSITNAPASASKSILFAPSATITNSNGYSSIICGYSCSTTSSQGGCNTVDQIEAYMLSYFPNSVVYAHRVQYGCWLGSQSVSAGGDCCASITNLTVTARVTDESCSGFCDGKVVAGAAGGTSPYSYLLNGSSVFSNLCSGSYQLRVSDALSNVKTDTVVVSSSGPPAPTGDSIQVFCGLSRVDDLTVTGSDIKWYASDTGSVALDSNQVLVNGNFYFASSTVSGCEGVERMKVKAVVLAGNVFVTQSNGTLTAAAAGLTYQWLDCQTGIAIGGATNRSFTPSVSGTYAVIIFEGSCADTSDCTDVLNVGLGQNNAVFEFSIHPNPAVDEINFSFANLEGEITLNMYSTSGALVFTSKEMIRENKLKIKTELEAGLYFIQINHNGSVSAKYKVVITN